MALVEISGLVKNYETGGELTKVLSDLELSAEKGEMIMIMGPSGCGKTTLLNLMGGIDKPNSGTILVDGQDVTEMGVRALNEFRRDKVGFIFQFYNLLPTLTALDLVGLSDKQGNFPQELSAGQQQRVAIARALAKEPIVIFADEPTGNLDEDRSESIMGLMKRLQDELGITFFIVSHNSYLKEYVDRTLLLRHGVIEEMGA